MDNNELRRRLAAIEERVRGAGFTDVRASRSISGSAEGYYLSWRNPNGSYTYKDGKSVEDLENQVENLPSFSETCFKAWQAELFKVAEAGQDLGLTLDQMYATLSTCYGHTGMAA